ncbi:hypothetical protein HN512_05260 [Candidatus Peregrinibacteria bacterium]|jgi:hypothetical protein|nr:hypothetical protein [Candidatus Peregrinibacteria bacterium]MBT3599214.1 hypothetical protein [Candidatus Peregrinibacteria bacterium]MBT4367467.1 hypothetical protein [Candidatus Peregrinibacteria bacterium]MBT4585587.1 hypothetical protein [Candidatus Peregrinibacteria bacterium]MBT6731015.1 hypothetical protein [Candidatus Peregrinibacteria bacterium]
MYSKPEKPWPEMPDWYRGSKTSVFMGFDAYMREIQDAVTDALPGDLRAKDCASFDSLGLGPDGGAIVIVSIHKTEHRNRIREVLSAINTKQNDDIDNGKFGDADRPSICVNVASTEEVEEVLQEVVSS